MSIRLKSKSSDSADKLAAISRSQAVIEFTPDGRIKNANDNFLNLMGYRLDEIVDKHHSLFVDPDQVGSKDYIQFWADLKAGKFQSAEFRRKSKSGKNVWIQATYNPILDKSGTVCGIIKIATDVSASKSKSSKDAGLISAINASQAVIHFDMTSTILDANENFCKTVGYSLEEIRGQKHAMFVAPEDLGPKYEAFWDSLRRGEFQTAEFKRIGKNGQPIYIQATYTPIVNFRGHAYKVVKFATDITERVLARLERAKTSAEIDTDLSEIEKTLTLASQRADAAATASAETSENVQNVARGSSQGD